MSQFPGSRAFSLGAPLNGWEDLILGLSLGVTISQVHITQSTSQDLGLAAITNRFPLGGKGWEVHLTEVHRNTIPVVFKPRRCPILCSAQSFVNLANPITPCNPNQRSVILMQSEDHQIDPAVRPSPSRGKPEKKNRLTNFAPHSVSAAFLFDK